MELMTILAETVETSTKFTAETERKAREIIRHIIGSAPDITTTICSGHCHLGGIDIWAEEEANLQGLNTLIFPPKTLSWEKGYKPRNLQIAHASDIIHCIVVKMLPPGYKGMRFTSCYHCHTDTHVKSGGCWTAKRAKQARWWEI